MREVTFGDFAKLASKRGLTPERPSEFFHRVFQGRYAQVVIPYRSVLAFYVAELQHHQDSVGRHDMCACGCGLAVFDRKRWASPACKKRLQRRAA